MYEFFFGQFDSIIEAPNYKLIFKNDYTYSEPPTEKEKEYSENWGWFIPVRNLAEWLKIKQKEVLGLSTHECFIEMVMMKQYEAIVKDKIETQKKKQEAEIRKAQRKK